MRYEFVVSTPMSERAIAAFPELRQTDGPSGRTRLFGQVDDDVGLARIVTRFGDLGLDLVDIHRLPDGRPAARALGGRRTLRYEFTFAEPVPDAALAALPELARATEPSRSSTLYGPIEDVARLQGLVGRFRRLGLDMTDMHRLPD